MSRVVNDSLDLYKEKLKPLGVSVADYWAKCGQVALEAGRRNACK